ncbi:2-hydroxyacid dehydrogenase [Piscinibacter sp.]|uniref:2-hydroxyacid dehydrogenase n=1 Tax=Piscinibacter sp. TaxID=1903157 RepID=UPI002C78924C|nr:glyoxylate/hydroxypyruvate reductase A [Albitalea sp.]HUG25976.1 glyoxylate/hydroxypyruvate reductase A [Albitalea sp.]
MALLLATSLEDDELAQWAALLRAALPEETVVTDRADCDPDRIDVAVISGPRRGALQGLPSLRFIQSTWAGVERLVNDPTIPAEVPLARMVDPAMSDAMAETALWAVLSLHRGYFDYADKQRAHQWAPHPQRRADEVSVAVLGLGQIGTAVAQRIAAQGYRVIGWSRRETRVPGVDTRHADTALPSVLTDADIVVNLLPLTPATRGFFDKHRFAQMRARASLVNLARGGHVVDADLLDALANGRLDRAVLDVFNAEPLPPEHVFWSHPKVTVLPHVAASTDPRSAAAIVAANVRRFREGREPLNLVDRSRGY